MGRDNNYRRQLPGGGYVEVAEESATSGGHRAQVSVERRRDPTRRDGHQPPVIAAAEGTTRQSVFQQLLEIADDDVAVARALLQFETGGRAHF